MNEQVTIHAAGNVLAPALAELSAMGFSVSPGPIVAGERTYRATSAAVVVTATDTLQLLGLAILATRRGKEAMRPTDAEVEALLRLDGAV